ncbi:MAG: Ig-like domain-containing protein, partial [Pseudomonadota bacterium]
IVNEFTGEQLVYGQALLDDLNLDAGRSGTGNGVEEAILFGIEHVIGTSGDDQIFGSAENNTLEGAGGEDTLVGGDGLDTLSYANADEGVGILVTSNSALTATRILGIGTQDGNTDHDAFGDEATGFERVLGSDFNDEMTAGQVLGPLGPNVVTDVRQFYALFSEVPIPGFRETPALDMTLLAGAGDDQIVIGRFGDISVEAGTGDDTVTIASHGDRVDLGEGNDVSRFIGPGDVLYADPVTGVGTGQRDRDALNTVLFGGEGFDTAILDTTLAEISQVLILEDRVIVEQAIPAGVLAGLDQGVADNVQAVLPRQIYFDFEQFVTDQGQVILANLDPIVEADRTLVVAEDRNDPIPIGIELTESQQDLEFRLTGRPDGGVLAVKEPNGSLRVLDSFAKVNAEELQNLHFLTNQRYEFERGPVTFNVIGVRDDEGNVIQGAASIPTGRGVSLSIAAPVDPEGGPLTITIDEVPDQGDVFFLRAVPTPLGFGTELELEIRVQPGDVVTAEELADLRYRAEVDTTGPMGNFSYTVRDESAFDQTGIGPQIDDRRAEAEGRDGIASQTIAIEVDPREDAPKAQGQIFEFSPGLIFDDVLDGADPDEDAVTFELVSGLTRLAITQLDPVRPPEEGEEPDFTRAFGGDRGTLVFNADGSFEYTPESEDIFREGDLFYETTFRYRVREAEGGGQASAIQEVTLRVINPEIQTILQVDPDDPNQQVNPDPEPGETLDTSLKALGGQQTSDRIRGHEGEDDINGFAGADSIEGLDSNDMLAGGEDNDSLFGGLGDDTLMGGEGADLLDGGEGSDTASYDDAPGGVDVDLIGFAAPRGDAVGDELVSIENLTGSDFNDRLRGDNNANRLEGGGNSDLLVGRGGDDELIGGAGRDVLIGGLGVDRMEGGAGPDFFLFTSVEEFGPGFTRRDRIEDFDAIDVIDLSRLDADTMQGGDQAFTFIGQSGFSGAAGELRIAPQAVNDYTLVLGDIDGDSRPDFQLELAGLQFLEAQSFTL